MNFLRETFDKLYPSFFTRKWILYVLVDPISAFVYR